MSYILDALKKMEHEKSQKIRGNGVVSISGVLFKNESSMPVRTVRWKTVLAVMVAVLVTFTVTWQFFQSGKVQSSTLSHVETPAFQPPSAKIEAAALPPVSSIVPVKKPLIIEQTTEHSAPAPAINQKVSQVEDPASLITLHELRKRQITRKDQSQPSAQIVTAPADIKLSGIAYQDERRARRAVVNGFLIQEGAVVSGAVVTDIFQDRVRFSLAGSSFELSLASSGVPASGK